MTSQALSIADQIDSLTETEIEFLWGHLKRRRNDALLNEINLRLEEAKGSPILSDEEVVVRRAKLGLD